KLIPSRLQCFGGGFFNCVEFDQKKREAHLVLFGYKC
ncbi:MAG: hypothetical protein ACI837_003223, partial [Crocinitomicaceae bacterium]